MGFANLTLGHVADGRDMGSAIGVGRETSSMGSMHSGFHSIADIELPGFLVNGVALCVIQRRTVASRY